MPNISDILDKNKDKKKFSKKEYRPWNLSETLSNEKEVANEQIDYPVKVDPIKIAKHEPISQEPEESVQDVPLKSTSKTEVVQLEEAETSFSHIEPTNLAVEDFLLQLSGRQKELLILIIRNLVDNKSLITSPMYAQSLVEKISTSLGTIKNAVRRLESKGLIKSASKRARGGYYRFEVKEEIVNIGQRLFFRP